MNLTMKQKSALHQAAERGIRKEQPIRVGRIVLVLVALVVLWGVM